MRKKNSISEINKKNRSATFYKFFLVISISMMIPVVMITSLIGKVSHTHLLKQVNLSRESLLDQKRLIVEQKIDEVSAIVDQLVNNESVWKLVTTSGYTVNHGMYMRDSIGLFSKNASSNEMIDSIYLYNDVDDFILSDSKYSKDEFADIDILNVTFEGFEYITVPRIVKGTIIFSYIKKFSSFDNNSVYIVINLNYDNFWKSLSSDSDGLKYFIFNDEYSIIYEDDFYQNEIDKNILEKIVDEKDINFEISHYKDNLYFWKSISSKNKWTFVLTQKSEDLFQAAYILRKFNILSLIIILGISFILAYFFSGYLYKPIRELTKKINQVTQIDTINSKNEYQLIEKVVAYLFSKNIKLNNDYEYVLPYFKQHSINDVLSGDFDLDNFKQVLELLDVNFEFSKHYLVLLELENQTYNNEIKRQLEESLDLINMKKIISNINEKRILIIINTMININEIYGLISQMHDKFNQNNIKLTISLSDTFEDLESIQENYDKVQKQLEYKFFVGKNKVLSHMVPQQIDKNIFYDKSLEKQLLNYLKKQNEEEACSSLRKLTEGLKGSLKNIDYIKYVYFQVCLNIIEQMTNFGFSLKDVEITNREIFAGINEANTLDEMYNFIDEIIRKCIRLFSKLNVMQNDTIINKVKEYINNNYSEDLSLERIAEYVYLSPGYLSTLFKVETGITVFDYLTNLRMEKAKEFLLTTNIKIQDIAIKVGYNSSQSFIRYFKKYYNITPNQFRKKQ